MVHWPEVIVTYDSTDKVLFSADGFGKFGASDAEREGSDAMKKKSEHPLRKLLLIPAQLVLDVLVLSWAASADIHQIPAEDALGHPFPVLTLLAIAVMGVATLVVIVLSIILTAAGLRKKRREKNQEAYSETI